MPKMSLTTYFQFTQTSYLPLPPTRQPDASQPPDSPASQPETIEEVTERGLRTAVKMLHAPELMIMLNPLVQHYSRISPNDPSQSSRLVNLAKLAPEFNVTLSSPSSISTFADSKNGEFIHYEIIDKFQFLGGLTSKLMTYRACFRPLYDASGNIPSSLAGSRESIGLETISDPGNGVALLGKWIVSEDDRKPGFLLLTESVQVHCNVFLGWYVRGQLESAHESLHKEFGRHFCERMVEEDPMKVIDRAKVGRTWKESQDLKGPGSVAPGISPVSRVGTDEMDGNVNGQGR